VTSKSANPSFSVGKSAGLFLMTNSFETGGSEKQFVALARSLESSDLRPQIGCISRKGFFLDGFERALEFPVGGSLYGVRSLQARRELARYLRESGVAVAHAFDFYTNVLMIPAAKIAGVPVVIGSQRQLGDLLSPFRSRAQAAILRWCDRVVCNSRAAATRLIAQGIPSQKIAIIGNGLTPSAFAHTAPALPRSCLRVGMIARMNSRSKNHHTFLRAAARMHSKFPETEFLLAGDGPLRSEFERLAQELGIHHRTHFLGDQRDIPAMLASIDVSVVPSASESLSNAILESMAAGIPVVATNVGGNPELVTEDRGFLVPVDDENRLAEAVERLLVNPALRAGFGRSARAFAESNFTIARVSKQHEELYTEALAAKSWRPTRQFSTPQDDGGAGRRVRVAIVAPSLRYVGGQSVQADLLLKGWQNDPDVKASLEPIDPPFPTILKRAESIPVLRTIIRQPFYLWSLWRALREADIAHIFSASYWSFILAPTPALLIARALGTRTLVHYHSGEAEDHLRRFFAARATLALADQLIVPSGYLVDVFREFGLEAAAVPNIIDLSQFSFRARDPLRPHLLCTRGFHPYYGVDVVVRAFAAVQQTYPEARLDLVGGGPVEAEIRALVEQLQLQNVTFAGVASRQEIGKFYDQADIFINGSGLDNMPVSILEAFASGTPVVSTEPSGMRYLIEHERTGLLSPPGDAPALAKNVLRLLREPALVASITANAHPQSKSYNWEAVREHWLQVYRLLLRQTEHAASKVPSGA